MKIFNFGIPVLMKKWGLRILLMCCLIALGNIAKAQVNQYTFSQSTSVYNPVSGTVLATATATSGATTSLDSHISNIPDGSFPFPFNFNGTNYTGCNMSSNGFITFGSTAPTTTLTTPISSTTAYNGAISAWAGDLNAVFNTSPSIAGSMRWDVIGIAPNRILVFEWTDFRPAFSSSTTNVYRMNFQIRLHEGSNIVSIIYGSPQGYVVGSTAISGSRQIGLRGLTNTDFNNRTNTTGVLFTSSAPGTLNSSTQAFNTINATPGMPAVGLTYTWAPPTCFPPTGLTATNITTTSTTLNWTAPTLGVPVSYAWEVRTSGAPGSGPVGLVASGIVLHPGTSDLVSGLSSSTVYSAYIRSDCGSGDLSGWNSANFTTAMDNSNPPVGCTLNINIPDNGCASNNNIILPILVSGAPGISLGNDVIVTSVELVITQTFNADLDVRLKSPNNVIIDLFLDRFSSGDNIGDPVNCVTFNLVDGGTPLSNIITNNPTGNWNPEQSLTLFNDGSNPNGTWQLIICDDAGGDVGALKYAHITFGLPPSCPIPSASSATNVIYNSAEANWSCSGCTGTFILEYGEASIFTTPGIGNTAGTGGTVVLNATSPHLLSGLNPSTQYRYFVRQDCGGGLFSDNSAGILFTTPAAPPVNDECIDAITVSCSSSPVAGTTINSTIDAIYSNCGAGGNNTDQRGVWYKYVGDNNLVTITTCDPGGLGYDTRLTVYSGSCGVLTCVTGNDDMSPACPTGSFRSLVQFNAFTGTDYYVFVHGFGSPSATGNFNLHISCEALCLPVPLNDDCASAQPLTVDLSCISTPGNNECAAAPITNPTCFSAFATLPDVWYSFIATEATQVLKITYGTATSLGFAVYSSCGGTQMACNTGVTSGANNPLTGLTAGNTYFVQVLSSVSSAGTFDICITPPPPPTCPTSHTPSNNAVNVQLNQQLSWSGSQFAASYNVYFGTTINPPFAGNTTSTTFNPGVLVNSSTYYWRVEPINNSGTTDNCIENTFTTVDPPPANDLCADAFIVNCGDIVSGQTVNATNTGNGPTCTTSASTAGGVWYKFIGDGKIVTASLCGSSYDTKIFIYTGTCGNFTCVTGNDDFCGLQSQVTFTSSIGVEYYILVAGFSTATGNFTLSLTCECNYSASIAQSLTGNCNQINLTANASQPGNYTYLWSTGETTQTIQVQVSSSQTYSVTVFDASNCDESASTTVEFNNGPAINVTPVEQLFCGAANVQLDAGSSGSLIFSNNNLITIPSSGTATPYPSGINVSGLSLAATVESVILSNISHTFPGDLDIALVSPSGEVVVLMSDIGGGTDIAGVTYTIMDGNPAFGSGLNPTGTYSPTNSGSSDTWAAPGPGAVTQASPALSMFTGNPNGTWQLFVVDDAGGDLGSIGGWSIEFADASALTYSWTPNLNLSDPNIPNPIATPTTSTLYTVVVTDPSSGCTSSGSANILVDPVPMPVIQPDDFVSLCEGESITFSTQYSLANGYQFAWGQLNDPGESFTTNLPGNYTMTVTSPNGCVSDPVPFTLEMTSIFADVFEIDSVSCHGGNDGSVEILALGAFTEPSGFTHTGPFEYSLNNGPLQSSPVFTGLSAGNYTVEVHDPISGCVLSIPIEVFEPVPLTVSTSVLNNVTCYGGSNGSATAQGSGGVGPYNYNWLTPIPKQVPTNNEIPAGTWTVVVEDANGCTATATVTITQPAAVVVSLGPDRVVPYGQAGSYNYNGCTDIIPVISGAVAPIQSYQWSTGATTATINVCNPTPGVDAIQSYSVTVTDANGCIGVGTVTLIFAGIDCSNNSNGTKIKICNVPPGNPSNCNTICVSVNAAAALLANGSYVGQCNPGCAPARIMASEATTDNISVNLMPNPTTGRILVDFVSENQSATSIVVTDLQGRIVMNVALDGSASFTKEVDMSGLENGLYILNIMNNEGLISTSRVVKAN